MRTIETNLYTFEELSPEAREKAIERLRVLLHRDFYPFEDWWDVVYEQFREDMKAEGIDVDEMYFSGFWSQGDGASFTGTITLSEKQLLELMPEAARNQLIDLNTRCRLLGHEPLNLAYQASIKTSGNYSHENTMRIDSYENLSVAIPFSLEEELVLEAEQLRDEVLCNIDFDDGALEIARDHARKLYHDLEVEYEYLTSDEVVAEHLTINDYEFLEDGSPA
jgi:hypothetical protein